MRKFCIDALEFGMGTENKQIFSIPPNANSNPKPRKQRAYYEIINYVPLLKHGMIKVIIAKQNQTSNRIREYHNAQFIICNSCLWCASYLAYNDDIPDCPTCRSNKIELLPISEKEAYQIGIEHGGISIEFWNI